MYKYEFSKWIICKQFFPSIANLKCALSDKKIYPKRYMHPRLWTLGLIIGVRLRLGHKAGVTKLFETQNCFLVQILAKGYHFDTQTSEIKIYIICLHMMLPLIIKKDIHHCKETDHVFAIVRTCHGQLTWSIRTTWFPQAPCWWPLV